MNEQSSQETQMNAKSAFDLVRLSKSKEEVGVCPNTIRKFHAQGLPLYGTGKVVLFSRAELATFLRSQKRQAKGREELDPKTQTRSPQ